MDAPGVQQWNKGPWRKAEDTAKEGKGILHDLQEINKAANHNSPPLDPNLSQINPVLATSSYLSKIHLNIINPHMS
jgi:hypothetical protein